ncbi:MAG: ribonuclease PH [Candidatus Glassbacteria bacterium]|nr:ribonuclease PH [Candidatus Glassbacteria bacterium]
MESTDKQHRKWNELRTTRFDAGVSIHAEGSCLAVMGDTRVLCMATIEDGVPPFLDGKGRGWVTAEYGMLPRSTNTRQPRERSRSGAGGRVLEISRLIGRSLRMTVDLEALGERTVTLDCDVIQADGGTRCCAINGAMVALYLALERLVQAGDLPANPCKRLVSAVSVGLVDGSPVLDLDYAADSNAEVDMNVVMTDDGGLVEVQGTAEKEPMSREDLDRLLELTSAGIKTIVELQKEVLGIG